MRSKLRTKRSLSLLLFLSLLNNSSKCDVSFEDQLNQAPQEETGQFQEKKEMYEYAFFSNKGVKTKIGGYVKAEYYYDSRQVTAYSVDQLLVYPKKKKADPNGIDINHRGEGHAVAIESRLGFTFEGTKVASADLSGILEADFWAIPRLEFDPIPFNLFRLRHAALFLKWCDELTLTLGQYWYPIFIGECYPHTVSFNDGSPFDPYGRQPEVLIDYNRDDFHIIGAAAFQLDYANVGPHVFEKGAASYKYNAYSMVPNLNLSFKKFFGEHGCGAGIDYNRMVPRIESDTGYSVIEPVNAVSFFGWLALNWPHKFEYHSKFTYGQNLTQYKFFGGIATHEIKDPITDERSWTTLNAAAIWWDLIAFPECPIEPALFAGVIKRVGSLESVIVDKKTPVFGVGQNIDLMFRLSPRCRWRLSDSLTVAAELEYTQAYFGKVGRSGKVVNVKDPVRNIRGLVAAYYWF